MYPMYHNTPFFMPPPSNKRSLKKFLKDQEAFEQYLKQMEAAKKDKEKDKKPEKKNGLGIVETFILAMVFGPLIGIGQLWVYSQVLKELTLILPK